MDEAQIKAAMEKIKAAWWNRQLIDDGLRKVVRLPEVMEVLIIQLGNEDFSIRTDAGFALAEIVGEAAKGELVNALSSERWQARAAAAEALGHYDDFQMTHHLIPLLNDPSQPVRITVAETLESLRDPSAVPDLIEAIKDINRHISVYAVYALYEIAREHEIPELFPYLKSDDAHLRVAAAYVLGAKGGRDAVRGLIDLVRVGMHGDKTEYERAREELQLIGEPALDELIEALNERDDVLSQLAIEVLVPIGNQRALPHIVAAIGDENDQVYEVAMWGASEFGDSAVPLLFDALKDDNPRLRAKAAQTLVEMPFIYITQHMVDLLKDADAEVRRIALFALDNIGDLNTVKDVIPLLQGSAQDSYGKWTTAHYAAQALNSRLSTPEGIAAVELWKKEEAGKGI